MTSKTSPAIAAHPRDALFAGERPFPVIPACEHFAGSEKLIAKALELQSKMGRVFDITCDCEDGAEVLTWVRWVMVAMRKPRDEERAHAPEVPELPKNVEPSRLSVPKFLKPAALEPRYTGSTMLWEDYTPGDVIDHPGGMTLEESEHMLATRLYQNTARIHFDALAAHNNPFGKRIVYGGHVISVCRALSYDGLENAFAVAAIHAGSHANATFAGDTLRCRHIVLGRDKIPGRDDIGAMRLRMIGAKNASLAELPEPGEKNPAVVLDLDYSVLIPRRQSA